MKRIGVKLLLLLVISAITGLQAQDTAVVADGGKPSTPVYNVDTTVLDSFYRSYGIDIHTAAQPELFAEVFHWYRTCYRYGGSGTKGIDCSGFTNMLYEKVYDKKIPRASYLIYEECRTLGKKEEMQEGDFVFFKIKKKRVSHVGVYLQNNKFAHSSTQMGVIISDLDEAYYRKYFFKAGRLK